MLWVRLPNALAGGRALLLAVCYSPPCDPGPEAADADDAWFQRLASDWVQALTLGVPVLAGDFNARTKRRHDWPSAHPCSPRRSCDGTLNARGQRLLRYCKDVAARLCNGHVPGDEHGAATSWG